MSKITIINNGEAKFFSHSEFHNVEFVTNKLCINVGEAEPKAEAPRPNAAEEAVAEEIKAVGVVEEESDACPLPDELRTPQAEALMAKLVAAGLLDEKWQPVGLSNTQKVIIANEVASKLRFREVWKVFGALWGMKSESLRSYFKTAQKQTGYDEKRKAIKDIIH